MIDRIDTPGGTVEHFSALVGEGRLDDLIALYEPDAAFMPEPGRVVSGTESIRVELQQLVALAPRMTGVVEQVLHAGDTALVGYRWRMEATAPDGTAVRQGGVSADVLRRRPDGTWGVLIDAPYGVDMAAATNGTAG